MVADLLANWGCKHQICIFCTSATSGDKSELIDSLFEHHMLVSR